MPLNLSPIKWEATGRKYEVLNELDQSYDPPRYCWSGGVGEQQIHDGADWQPYIWDGVNNEIRYSADDFRCRFESTHQAIKKAGNFITKKLQFYVDVEHPTQPENWLFAPHGAPTRNMLHNKRFRNKVQIDDEGYCIGYLDFPNAKLPNTTPYELQVGIQAGRKQQAQLGFRFKTTVSGRVRFQIVLDGITKGVIEDFTLLRGGGGFKGREERVVGVRYKDVEFRWTYEESAYHTVSVEDSTEYVGEKKGIITVGPFDYTANDQIKVLPLTWGLSEASDDCYEENDSTFVASYYGGDEGIYITGTPRDGGFTFSNVTVPAGATAENGCYVRGYIMYEASTPNGIVKTVDSRSVATWASGYRPSTHAPKHTSSVTWNNISNDTYHAYINSPEIKTILQSRLDGDAAGAHQSGDDIGILILDNASSGEVKFAATEYASKKALQLYVVYTAAAVGDLSIDISQSIEVSESVSLAGLIQDLTVDLSEQLNLSEFVSTSMNLGAISINETVNLAEALTSGVPLSFSKFENITLTEFLALLETIAPSAFESITATEYLALLKDIGLSEFESITVNELVAASLESAGVDVSESIELSEFISILKDIGIDTAQNITVTEVIAGVVSLAGISAVENITIIEAVAGILAVAGIDTAQSINVSEFISGLLSVSGIDVSQDITLTEYLNLLVTGDLPITDAHESITIAESLTLLFNFLPLSEIQNINLSEFVSTLLSTTGIDVSDTINLSEAAILMMSLATISVSDSVTLTEAVTALLETTGANVYDTISITEYIQAILGIAGISVSESVTISEFVYVTMVTVAGIMKVNFSVRRPGLTYSTRRPKITFH